MSERRKVSLLGTKWCKCDGSFSDSTGVQLVSTLFKYVSKTEVEKDKGKKTGLHLC